MIIYFVLGLVVRNSKYAVSELRKLGDYTIILMFVLFAKVSAVDLYYAYVDGVQVEFLEYTKCIYK